MTQAPGPHFSPDDIDLWLDGTLAAERVRHLDACRQCLEMVLAEREIVEQVAALPFMSPTEGFADRVMQSVSVPDPFAIRSISTARRRLFASPRSVAVAASLVLVLVGSMAGSIVWSLNNQETLAAFGSWVLVQGGQALWLAVRGVASNVIEQPWYDGAKVLVGNPTRLAVASAAASFAYLGGVLALRRLLALPTQGVAHAGL
jgi:hypothetical protein